MLSFNSRERYRNFRTFTTPRPVQFSCLAIDATDEFIAAGAHDVFDIYLWSMKLGQLIEVNDFELLRIDMYMMNSRILMLLLAIHVSISVLNWS